MRTWPMASEHGHEKAEKKTTDRDLSNSCLAFHGGFHAWRTGMVLQRHPY